MQRVRTRKLDSKRGKGVHLVKTGCKGPNYLKSIRRDISDFCSQSWLWAIRYTIILLPAIAVFVVGVIYRIQWREMFISTTSTLSAICLEGLVNGRNGELYLQAQAPMRS